MARGDRLLAWDNRLFRENLGLLPDALQAQLRSAMGEFLDLL